MFVLSSPSGAGKTTLSRALLIANNELKLSVSTTTRIKRPSEKSSIDYNYIDIDQFKKMIEADEFLEHAEVFGNYYGTLKSNIKSIFDKNCDVLFDIDWQGMESIKMKYPDDLVSVFILPPSMNELEDRLKKRASDSEDVIKSRMSKAYIEITNAHKYDYVIVNSDISDSLKQISSIIAAERLKRERLVGLESFVNSLKI